MQPITDHLVDKHNFTRILKLRSETDLDFDLFTCLKRIHVIHYLFYSEEHKAFSIALKREQPKGLAGGGFKQWNTIMLPKVIYSVEDVENMLKGLL